MHMYGWMVTEVVLFLIEQCSRWEAPKLVSYTRGVLLCVTIIYLSGTPTTLFPLVILFSLIDP